MVRTVPEKGARLPRALPRAALPRRSPTARLGTLPYPLTLTADTVLLTVQAPADAHPGEQPAAGARSAAVSGLLPQREVPELDVPGDAQPVEYPPDFVTRPASSTLTFTAPAHTRIKVLDKDCQPQPCTQSISADGTSVTLRTPGRWRWATPVRIWLQGDHNAPMPRTTYTGSLTLDREHQPLAVVITQGRQGALGAVHQTASGGGAQVIAVNVDSAADEAGIRPGDTITSFNNRTITTAEDLRAARVGILRSGSTVPVTDKRPDNTTRTTTLTLR